MYHFTFIDETSTEFERLSSETQEQTLPKTRELSHSSQSLLKKTGHFLYKYLEQPNCVRIYISKN